MDEISFIDANIFMYAAGASHPYKDSCVRILRDIETENLVAAVNTEIFQELLYRYSHIKLADKGVHDKAELLKYPLTILAVTEADIRLAIFLYLLFPLFYRFTLQSPIPNRVILETKKELSLDSSFGSLVPVF